MRSIEKRNITDERKELFEILQQWEDHLSQRQDDRRGEGNDVEVGELAVYGVLRGLHGLPVHSDVMSNFARIASWYEGLERRVEKGT